MKAIKPECATDLQFVCALLQEHKTRHVVFRSLMDESERMLLRRRKQHIAESVELNADLLDVMRQSGLLTDDTVAMLQVSFIDFRVTWWRDCGVSDLRRVQSVVLYALSRLSVCTKS